MTTLDQELANLYGQPLESFISERNALSKDLEGRGEREAAARVKALRKPTPALWAVNQAVRRKPDDTGSLLEASELLRRMQQEPTGGSAASFRTATRARHRLVSGLVDEASALLAEAGRAAGAAVAERVRRILYAASSEESLGEALRHGRLTVEPGPSGFEEAFGTVPEQAAVAPAADRALEKARREAKKLADEAEQAATTARRAEEEARRAEEEAAAARLKATATSERATAARARADEAAGRVAELDTD